MIATGLGCVTLKRLTLARRPKRGSEATVHNFCQMGANQPLMTPAIVILSNKCKRAGPDGAGTVGGRGGTLRPRGSSPGTAHAAPIESGPRPRGVGRFRW